MATLKTTHNAGFFSCSTIALMDVVNHVAATGKAPFRWDRKEQYHNYKPDHDSTESLIPYYFSKAFEKALPDPIPTMWAVPDCMAIQFGAYKSLPFAELKPYVDKYFTPSHYVLDIMMKLAGNYRLNFDNLCAVFYRGNDKATEMKIAPYKSFIERARIIKKENPEIRFLVQPDEAEFLTEFLNEFPDTIYFMETPFLDKQNSAMFFEMPMPERKLYGATFFAAVLCLSRCKHIITHSGNGALWLALYRGNSEGINQIHNGEWL